MQSCCYQGNAFSWLGFVLPLLFLVPGLEEAIITILYFALLTLSQKSDEAAKHPRCERAAPGRWGQGSRLRSGAGRCPGAAEQEGEA